MTLPRYQAADGRLPLTVLSGLWRAGQTTLSYYE
jgi:hypothetical protein